MSWKIGTDVRASNTLGVDISRGAVRNVSVVHKFGANSAVGTSFVPICEGGIYRTPQVSGATTLRIKAGGANDTAAGTGARTISLQGLDETGALVSETVSTNGASAGAASTTTFLRLFRCIVETSGTYATQAAGSHAAAVTIENGAGTEDWATISATDFPRGQSTIGVYTVPLGYTAYITNFVASTAASKTTDLLMFQRRDILQTAAPYSAMRQVYQAAGITTGSIDVEFPAPLGPFPALTDIGWMAKINTGTATVAVNFEIWLFNNTDSGRFA